jgi:hypothetical protein
LTPESDSARGRVKPSLNQRILFALAMALAAAVVTGIRIYFIPGMSDFGPVWYGAHALLHGVNPYQTFGPGLAVPYDWHLYYPATAMVAALPLGLISEPVASMVFACLSAALLAYGITRDSWDRAWIFFSASFVTAAKSAQWSPLIAAAFFLPALGFVVACKPSLGLAVGVSTPSRKTLAVAVIGGIVLGAIGLVLLPTWPMEWWKSVRTGVELNAPITRPAGFLVALALLRWRQPEARLLFAMACVPQTSSWYETLIPLLVARTKREMQVMVFASGIGYLSQIALLDAKAEIATTDIGVLMVVFVYLPALAIVLRRPNEGDLPAWVRLLRVRQLRVSAVLR